MPVIHQSGPTALSSQMSPVSPFTPSLNQKMYPLPMLLQAKRASSISVVIQDTKLITTATTSGVTLDSDTLFYIRPTTDEVLPVGFTGNGVSTPSDAVTTDFIFYGTYLMWEYDDGSLSDSFRAKETNVTDVYELYYDFSNLYPSGYETPVVKSSS